MAKYTNDQKLEILASIDEIGVKATQRKYNVSKSATRSWRLQYKRESLMRKKYKLFPRRKIVYYSFL